MTSKEMHNGFFAPFPYFGGKREIAPTVWQYLGNQEHYIEPFFGSGAVLLSRPHRPVTETVNDANGFICNVWRSIKLRPKETARWADWPVNHVDLAARRFKMIDAEKDLLRKLIADPVYCDPILAGYWIWATSSWIGGGLTKKQKDPKGIGCRRPHLSTKGMGVHTKKVRDNIGIERYFFLLSNRLRKVRVTCGDFMGVLGGNWQDGNWETVGIFFDPPYGKTRAKNCYHVDSMSVWRRVEKYCLMAGARKGWRIVVAGYDGEYPRLLKAGWTAIKWSASAGLSTISTKGNVNENRHRERLFVSPAAYYLGHSGK